MDRVNVKLGQKVRVTSATGFYTTNIGKEGVVTSIENVRVYVSFEDGTRDFGYASDLELMPVFVEKPVTVHEAIANVEAALAVLKALVG